MMRIMRERKRGFTIIELLIVIAIIAILAAVAIPALLKAQKSGKESAALQMLKSMRAAEELHKTRMVAPKSYCDLDGLSTDGAITFGNGGTDATSGYHYTIVVGQDDYTITAIPPKTDMTTYTMNEQGVITP